MVLQKRERVRRCTDADLLRPESRHVKQVLWCALEAVLGPALRGGKKSFEAQLRYWSSTMTASPERPDGAGSKGHVSTFEGEADCWG